MSMSEYNRVLVPGLYRHFKGHLYRVLGTGRHSETQEEYVIYMSVSTGEIWLRPYDMFMSKVDREKYPNVEQEYRFEYVGELKR